tara:strand:- start:2933 stop:3472 length:540 start_codon:yes stop_codon:yes gene_type:complete
MSTTMRLAPEEYWYITQERATDATNYIGIIMNRPGPVGTSDKYNWFYKNSPPDSRLAFVAKSYHWIIDWDIFDMKNQADRKRELRIAKPEPLLDGKWSLTIANPLADEWHEEIMPGDCDPRTTIRFLIDKNDFGLVQNVFPTLSIDQREFISTGMSGNYFDKTCEDMEADSECTLYNEE